MFTDKFIYEYDATAHRDDRLKILDFFLKQLYNIIVL